MNPEPLLVESTLNIELLQLNTQSEALFASSPSPSRKNLRSVTYDTAKEARNGLDYNSEGMEDENDVTTDTGDDSEGRFDSSDDDDFDLILGNDYIAADDNMDVD
jgi:hypothetical protein